MKEATATISGRVVSPKEFVKVYTEQRGSIVSADIVPAQLGKKGFGAIVVHERDGRVEIHHINPKK